MTTTASLQERLLGTWQLLSFEVRAADGTVQAPFGSHPSGLLIYTPSGSMAVQICHAERVPFAAAGAREETVEEMVAAYQRYLAYFGTYAVDEAASTVTHHVAAATFPNLVGAQEVRHVQLDGEELTLRAALPRGPEPATAAIVWRRTA